MDAATTVIITTIQHQVSHIEIQNLNTHSNIKTFLIKKKTENSYSEFNTLLFETDVNTTTYFTNNSISTWIKESNDRHQIVGFLRFNSSVNSLEPHVTSIIKPLGVHS